jgi:hypothetical protein
MKVDTKDRSIEGIPTGEEPVMDLAKGDLIIIGMDFNRDNIDQILR